MLRKEKRDEAGEKNRTINFENGDGRFVSCALPRFSCAIHIGVFVFNDRLFQIDYRLSQAM